MAEPLRLLLPTLLLLSACVASSLSASVESCVSYGGAESSSEVRLSELLASYDFLARTAANGRPILTRGRLRHGKSPVGFLCDPERLEKRRSPECLPIGFEWNEIGAHEEEMAPILAQWTGREVVVSALVSTNSLGGSSGVLTVQAIRLIERPEPVPRSYCIGYTGPLGPSAAELRARKSGVRAACRSVWIPFDGGRAKACLEDYEPIIWLRRQSSVTAGSLLPLPGDQRRTFDLPAPYAARDIWEFAPVTENVYLVTLVDGRLFSLAEGKLRELEGPKVDQLSRTPESNVVYYRLRTTTIGSVSTVTELRAIDENLTPRTLWKSDSERISVISVRSGWPLTLFVEGRSGRRILTRDEDGNWVTSPVE